MQTVRPHPKGVQALALEAKRMLDEIPRMDPQECESFLKTLVYEHSAVESGFIAANDNMKSSSSFP